MHRLPQLTCLIAIGLGLTSAVHRAGAQTVDPQTFFNQVMANPNLNPTPENGYGEGWAWHAKHSLQHFLRGYQAWGDPEWLNYGVQYYDFVVSKMSTAPDGYKGWIGKHIDNSVDYWQDTHVSDGFLVNEMLNFAEVVKKNSALNAQWGHKADEYIELAKVHVLEKWDARGTYRQHGELGGYVFWNMFLPTQDLNGPFFEANVANANITQQFNKQHEMALTALRLYRITGEESYRERAVEIFSFHKSRMQLYDDHHIWNFREPFDGAGVNVSNNTVETWVAVHPTNGGYQNTEVGNIVEAYHSGIVFTEQDIQRIINTNIQVMWNQSTSNPKYKNSNAAILPNGLPDSNDVGRLWSALGDFDQQVRDLRRFGSDNRSLINKAYFENVTLARPAGFSRLLMEEEQDLRLFNFPFGETRFLNMAFAAPNIIEPGDEMVLAVRSLVQGSLQVGLFDEHGAQAMQLFSGSIGADRYQIFTWDGLDGGGNAAFEGDYTIRWTLANDGYREFPIHIGRLIARWIANADGVWSAAANWSSTVPSGSGVGVLFGPAISQPRTVTVDGSRTVGSITFDNANRYTLAGTGIITIDHNGGLGSIQVDAGSHMITAPLVLASDAAFVVVPEVSVLTVSNLTATGRNVGKAGDGTLAVNRVRGESLLISGGTVQIVPNGTSAGASILTALGISEGASLDLTNNSLLIRNGDLAEVCELVKRGHSGGTWTGDGITSSLAAAQSGRAVGLKPEGADVLVSFTWLGDATLSGEVDISDLGVLAANWQKTGQRWHHGDFNYDGKVDIADLGILAANWQAGTSGGTMTFAEALSLFDTFDKVAVPEPAAAASFISILGLMISRRSWRG